MEKVTSMQSFFEKTFDIINNQQLFGSSDPSVSTTFHHGLQNFLFIGWYSMHWIKCDFLTFSALKFAWWQELTFSVFLRGGCLLKSLTYSGQKGLEFFQESDGGIRIILATTSDVAHPCVNYKVVIITFSHLFCNNWLKVYTSVWWNFSL